MYFEISVEISEREAAALRLGQIAAVKITVWVNILLKSTPCALLKDLSLGSDRWYFPILTFFLRNSLTLVFYRVLTKKSHSETWI